MSVAKGRRQFVIVDRPGGTGWQTGGLAGNIVETAAFSYRVNRRLLGCNPLGRVVGDPPIEPRATDKEEHRGLSGVCDSHR